MDAMKGFGKFLAICAAIAITLDVAYLVIFPSVTLRYRLTVDVDLNGAVHTGSGVVEVFYQPLPDSLRGISGSAHFGGEMRGYAITVDLGERGLLFVVNSSPFLTNSQTGLITLPDGASLTMLPFTAFGLPLSGLPSEMLRIARELRAKKGPVEVPPDKLPMIVRFTDLTDLHSIEELDPRDLASSYGPGVRLANAQFELTDDPISPLPRTWPKWLMDAKAIELSFEHQRLWSRVSIWTEAFKRD
jgi:hypothetical protein